MDAASLMIPHRLLFCRIGMGIRVTYRLIFADSDVNRDILPCVRIPLPLSRLTDLDRRLSPKSGSENEAKG